MNWLLKDRSTSGHLTQGSEMLVDISPRDLKAAIVAHSSPLTLVNVWATWCPPCVEELPLLVKLREKYAARGVAILLYSADKNKTEAAELLRQIPVTFKNYSIGASSLNDLNELYPQWPGSLPVSLIFNSSGEIVDKWLGTVSLSEFEDLLNKHLSSPLEVHLNEDASQ